MLAEKSEHTNATATRILMASVILSLGVGRRLATNTNNETVKMSLGITVIRETCGSFPHFRQLKGSSLGLYIFLAHPR